MRLYPCLGRASRAMLLTWLAASSAWAEPRRPTHVACVGDSITAGGPTTYPANLQTLFGSSVQVKNYGHSGATMLSAGFGNLPYQQQPEYQSSTDFVKNAGAGAVVSVIIMLGANDSKPVNWTPSGKPKNDQQYLKDYRALVEHFAALSTKPAIYLALPLATGNNPCCTISGKVIHDEQLPLIEQLAREKGLPTIDVNTPTTNRPELFTDGVHPNAEGYTLVAKVMQEGLLRVPTVSLSSPAANTSVVAGAPVTFTATAAAGTVALSSVEFFAGTASLGVAAQAPYSRTVTMTVPGTYQITAKATDSTAAFTISAALPVTVVASEPIGAGGAAGASAGGAAGASAGGAAGASAGGAAGASAGGAAGTSTGGAGGAELAGSAGTAAAAGGASDTAGTSASGAASGSGGIVATTGGASSGTSASGSAGSGQGPTPKDDADAGGCALPRACGRLHSPAELGLFALAAAAITFLARRRRASR